MFPLSRIVTGFKCPVCYSLLYVWEYFRIPMRIRYRHRTQVNLKAAFLHTDVCPACKKVFSKNGDSRL